MRGVCILLQAKKQQRKLNFLITQTELYAHFMAKKLTGTDSVAFPKIVVLWKLFLKAYILC